MLEESGVVVGIEPDAIWVETLQKTTCGSCSARKGCGQHVLGEALGNASRIRVLLQGRHSSEFQLDQQVTIGIPEDVVVKGSLAVYLTPLLTLILFAWLGYSWVPTDAAAALAGLLGLLAGGLLVRWHAWRTRHDPRLQPVVI